MKLDEYLAKNKIKRYLFAIQIGISPSSIEAYCNGRRKPSEIVAVRIERATKGQVSIEELRKEV